MFEKLAEMLRSLKSAQGSKAKSELLKKFVGDDDFKWMARMALDQGHSFGIEEFPAYQEPGIVVGVSLVDDLESSIDANLVQSLESIKEGSGVTDDTLLSLWNISRTSEARYLVVDRIIHKDLRCGVQAKTVNKVAPGLVFQVPYQRCSQFDRIGKMAWPAMLQRKANGMFAYLLPTGEFMSRQGNKFEIPGNPISPFIKGIPDLNDKVLIQELIVLGEDGNVMDRAEGNGILNSFLKGKGAPAIAPRVRSYCWGWVTQAEFHAGITGRSYKETWLNLEKWLPLTTPTGGPAPIRPIEAWYVKDLVETKAKFLELIAVGEEGGIVKSLSPDFIWQDQSACDFQIKMKAEAEAEFEIVDAYLGDPRKKYAGLLGGITIKSSDGLIVSDCGGGFTDAQRKLGAEHWQGLKGSIVSVCFNGVTVLDSVTGARALDHPRFVELRPDKSTADTLEYCLNALKEGAE